MGEVIRCKHCGQKITAYEFSLNRQTVWLTFSSVSHINAPTHQHEPMLKSDYIKKFNEIWKQQTS